LWIFGIDPHSAGPGTPFQDTKLRYFEFRQVEEWLDPVLPASVPQWCRFTLIFAVALLLVTVIVEVGLIVLRLLREGSLPKVASRVYLQRICCGLVRGAFAGLSLYLVLKTVVWQLGYPSVQPALLTTVGVPLLLGVFLLAGYGEMAVCGWCLDEYEREWRSRLGAYIFMCAAGWLAVCGATLLLPRLLVDLEWPGVNAALAALWAAISAGGAWAGQSPRTSDQARQRSRRLELLGLLAPPVFLVGLLALVSLGVASLIPVLTNTALKEDRLFFWGRTADPELGARLGWYFLLALALTWFFSRVINVNRFSLHMLYANRLTRCYLGASRRKQGWGERVTGPFTDSAGQDVWSWGPGTGGAPTNADTDAPARRENAFTGFDPQDDFPLADLRIGGFLTDRSYRGPYPLINTAINLVAGAELATQDRKAASFVLAPEYCGSRGTGYGSTPSGAVNGKNLTLGRAMTISGAAIDPNMGYHQSAPLTALMTVLNTRLGWWMRNPRFEGSGWKAEAPGFGSALWYELFGRTDENHKYIHLSDGGHFDNLGVYELIRRRCRYIVVTDAGTDRQAASESLAHLIRLVANDFGIRIDIDTSPVKPEGPERRSRWHCAIGLIRYDDVDAAAVAGVLIYLRASLTGDEPSDIQNYAGSHRDFPYDSTLNQFFDEDQFESYRGLGYHVAQTVFEESALEVKRELIHPMGVQRETRRLFARVRRRWFPPPPKAEDRFVEAAQKALDLEQNLRTDPRLEDLSRALYPEVHGAGQNGSAELHTVNAMLQVMEIAWFSMQLDDYYAHPVNRGWMNLFRRWTGTGAFHRYWPFLRAEYSEDFVRFCERALSLRPTEVDLKRLHEDEQLDVTLRKDLAAMDWEFSLEWKNELARLGVDQVCKTPSRHVEAAEEFARTAGGFPPFVWIIYLKGPEERVGALPCGIISMAPPADEPAGKSLELFLWLRGPYRNLGIGRQCDILKNIVSRLCDLPAPRPSILLARYPDSGPSHAEKLDKAMWMNFFFDYGFKTLTGPDRQRGLRMITLARQVPGHVLESSDPRSNGAGAGSALAAEQALPRLPSPTGNRPQANTP
jgi:hypothetical protein